ncbi:hypothetical protein PCASD_19136 [Puccinia coronata f. sp. avenae]|uniref:DDE Tnp4 domain-containing protein n=1 Tax=Puccinia coronata f. sp. avenae TaxID=200324 RepID=A0A2N5TSM9_9BASI|nr:hypothetical protein PCASD_19136 [Puccinia coronata f. sp. avenae]
MNNPPFPQPSRTARRQRDIQRRQLRLCFSQIAARRRQEYDEAAIIIVALASMGGPIRNLRTYLTRGDLPGDPLVDSAWAYLWSSQSDRAFITTMGVDVNTFETIHTPFSLLWNGETIPRGDVNPHGEPQPGRRALDSASCLGLVLHWLSSTMPAYNLQQLFAITPAVCSRYLACGLQYLLAVLKELRASQIVWPSSERAIRPYSNAIEAKFPLLTKCFGFVDGHNLPILVSEDDEF